MDNQLEKILTDFNEKITNLENELHSLPDIEDELESNIDLSLEFQKRLSRLSDNIDNLTNELQIEENQGLRENLTYFLERLNTFQHTLDTAENNIINLTKKIDDLKNNEENIRTKIENLKKNKAFIRLTTLKSFQSKISENADKVLSNPDLLGEISKYGGRKSKSRKVKSRRNRKSRKQRRH